MLDHFRRDNNRNRVRVAVLDTGINRSHSRVKNEKRIREARSFVPGLEGNEDTNGHGTYCAMLLNRVAPEADIYVARVAENGDHIEPEHVATVSTYLHPPSHRECLAKRFAQAIKHAVEKWRVQIISMSFGFSEMYKPVEEAVKLAASQDVLMFAAAANHGANSMNGRTYPARDFFRVFGIYSTDFHGNKSTFNPPASETDYNFSTLGEDVRSPWTGQEFKILTGTSVATPIAAATAALLLEFVRQPRVEGQPNISHVERLNTIEGMRLIFKVMAPNCKTSDCNYLKPWALLSMGPQEGTRDRGKIARQHIAFKINSAFVDHFGWS